MKQNAPNTASCTNLLLYAGKEISARAAPSLPEGRNTSNISCGLDLAMKASQGTAPRPRQKSDIAPVPWRFAARARLRHTPNSDVRC